VVGVEGACSCGNAHGMDCNDFGTSLSPDVLPGVDGGFQASNVGAHGDERSPDLFQDLVIKVVVRVVRIVQKPLYVRVVALPRRMVCPGLTDRATME